MDLFENANHAYLEYLPYTFAQRAELMYAVAQEIENLGDELIQTAHQETHLPIARLQNEKQRTINQWKFYADALKEHQVLIPKESQGAGPHLRKTFIGLGPVVVFGASNFPFAFSTAGGDTASAIAAGCSVIEKVHPAHPNTAKIMGEAIQRALPPYLFQQISTSLPQEAQDLVRNSKVKAVAFTGSYTAGMALYRAALDREDPIPVFAEMGSINPVIVLPEKLKNDANALAQGYIQSLSLGVGQFCTNPGLLLIPKNHPEFIDLLLEEAKKVNENPFLHPGIGDLFYSKKKHFENQMIFNPEALRTTYAKPYLALASVQDFLVNADWHEEVFGPFGLILSYESSDELLQFAQSLKGQLTCTLLGEIEELKSHQNLIQTLITKCGRLLFKGFPTGVEIVQSMHHGGPFPATTDSRFTSVGADAILRFAKPICLQDAPDFIVPIQ